MYDDDNGAQNAIFKNSKRTEDLEKRIDNIRDLLSRLKAEKEKLEREEPPADGKEMEAHIMDVSGRVGLSDDDIIYRTRKKSGERVKVPTGFTKQGVIEINNALYRAQQRIEQLESQFVEE